jgi:uncharacterized protein (UPF0333 family)
MGKRKVVRQKGQALVELALTLPLILLLILGAMDFGRLFYTKLILTNAAREGANYLAYNPDDKYDLYAVTHESLIPEANSSGLSVKTSEIFIPLDNPFDVEDGGCCNLGEAVEVKVVKSVPLIFGGFFKTIGLLEEDSLEISGKVRMVVQR